MTKTEDWRFKIVLIGDSGVGKSCITHRYTANEFKELNPTIAAIDLSTKIIKIDNKTLKLFIWDTAGQEKWANLNKQFYRGTHSVIMVYDISNRSSFHAIKNKWLKEVDEYASEKAVRVLAGTKLDLDNRRQVGLKEAEEFAREMDLIFMETSAKQNVNIDTLLMRTAHQILVTLFADGQPDMKRESDTDESFTECCSNIAHARNPCTEVHVDTSSNRKVSIIEPEEKALDPLTWRQNMEKLYIKNRSLFESYKIRSGWFISAKQDDCSKFLAERLYRDLEGNNWFDMYYNKARTRAAVIKGVLRRDKFLCFLSLSYFRSKWCVMELTTAFCGGKIIVPVFDHDINTSGSMLSIIPECFSDLKNKDFIGLFANTGQYKRQLGKIVRAGRGYSTNELYDSKERLRSISL